MIFTVFTSPCSGDAKPRVVRNASSFRLEDLDSGLGKTVDVNDTGKYVDCFTQVCYSITRVITDWRCDHVRRTVVNPFVSSTLEQ